MPATDSEFIKHVPCNLCGSSDANALYSDGHTHCFACDTRLPGDGAVDCTNRKNRMTADMLRGDYMPLTKRGIKEDTCKLFGYHTVQLPSGWVQVADYKDPEGALVGQKVRDASKEFYWTGSAKTATMFGQHLWRDKGKRVTITEGEIDALSVSQVQDNKWPVVSLKNGASGAVKDIRANLEWLLGFDEIVLFFDDDEPGRKAVDECAEVLPPGRCKVARIHGFKDANDALVSKAGAKIVDAIFGAKVHRPDGIVSGDALWEQITTDDERAGVDLSLPWKGLQDMWLGLRRAELTTLLAGSGIGKSTILRELVVHALQEGEKVGCLFLEETPKRFAQGLIGVALSRPIHLDRTLWADLPDAEKAARQGAWEAIGGPSNVHVYDHFGSSQEDTLINKIRYLVQGCGCGWVFLDHISIVVSGLEGDDERKLIDRIMTKLRMLVQETGCGLLVVSHLKRPGGDAPGHEEGAEVRAGQARGSHAIIQLSDNVVGFERNQQDPETSHITTVRSIKCRLTGETGVATHLAYDKRTGRLNEVDLAALSGKRNGFRDETPPPDGCEF